MFPLLDREGPNPLELFQIWLNLPKADKLTDPHFSMLWADTIPRLVAADPAGRNTEVTLVAGRLGDLKAPPPPPRSWASRAESDVAIWTLKMAPQATWTLPRAQPGSSRTLYFFRGGSLRVGDASVKSSHAIELRADVDVTLENGGEQAELLMLQGRPIGEPVVAYGPFVMNTPQEIQQAFLDYRRTEFGGWPFPAHGPVHARSESRFARHADGRVERA
jgi:redox-sensitive bicupin YhaK (pirin superfamily)